MHKSTPQTLKLREIAGKVDYTGLAFVGVRAQESATRAEYEYENYGKKQKGQYSHNPILEWTSAEIWLYIYANDVMLNEAYKKGSVEVKRASGIPELAFSDIGGPVGWHGVRFFISMYSGMDVDNVKLPIDENCENLFVPRGLYCIPCVKFLDDDTLDVTWILIRVV